MKKIPKNVISVDHHRQKIEGNSFWGDYPCVRTDTGRRLRRSLDYYFSSWKDYCENGNDGLYETK